MHDHLLFPFYLGKYIMFCSVLLSHHKFFPSEAEINTLSSYGSRYSRVFFSPYNP